MTTISVEPDNDYDEWTIIDINTINVVTESVGALHFRDESRDDNEIDNSYIELIAVPDQSSSNLKSPNSLYNPNVKSYRQALLSPSSSTSTEGVAVQKSGPLRTPTYHEWKPKIVVDNSIKFERKDRLYHHNLPPQCELMDDEDDFGESLFSFHPSSSCLYFLPLISSNIY